MYGKLAWRNIRRSLGNYAIYFLTLVFAVAVFYVFNSLGDQPVLRAFWEAQSFRFEFMRKIISMVSVFVSLVIGLLVLYANNFLIRRRKRELGTYMLLGLRQSWVAGLLLLENLLIGTVALGAGLGLGVLLSQFLALLIARLFSVDLQGLSFVLSAQAALKTLLYYGLAFVFIGLFSSVSVSRVQLLDLMEGDKRNEKQPTRITWLQVLVALVSLGLIGWGYQMALKVIGSGRFVLSDWRLWHPVLTCSIGTFGLYYGLSGLALVLGSRWQRKYYRGLNPFIIRQLTSRIQSSTRVLATITVMLTVTICSLGAGFAMRDSLMGSYDSYAPYDFMLWGSGTPNFAPIYAALAGSGAVVSEIDLRDSGFDLDRFYAYAVQTGTVAADEIHPEQFSGPDFRVGVLPLAVFNQLRSMRGYATVELAAGEYLVSLDNQRSVLKSAIDQWLQNGETINLAGQRLSPGLDQPYTDLLGGYYVAGNSQTTLVVADDVAKALPLIQTSMVINLPQRDNGTLNQKLLPATQAVYSGTDRGWSYLSRYEVWFGQYFSSTLLVFVAVYIGIIFLMAAASMLALQQLADAADNRHKYTLLSQIGAGDRLLSGALLRQLAIYFLIPAVIAAAHSGIALVAINMAAVKMGGPPILHGAAVTGAIFLSIYGIYFLLTHLGYKKTLGWTR